MPVMTIELDDAVVANARQATGLDRAEAPVEEWLRRISRAEAQKRAIRESAGIGWGGSLDELRASRF